MFGFKKKKSPLKNSYIIIGPQGVGKTIIAQELSKSTGLKVLHLDALRHSPTDIKKLEDRITYLEKYIKELQQDKYLANTPFKLDIVNNQIRRKTNELSEKRAQLDVRRLFPNLSSFEQMTPSYNPQIADYLKDRFGDAGWMFYQKTFEIKMLQEVSKNLPFPCIIDTGAGFPIFPKKDFDYIISRLDEDDFRTRFSLEPSDVLGYDPQTRELLHSYDEIKQALSPCENIIYLESLITPLKSNNKKAYESRKFNGWLNSVTVEGKRISQFKDLCTHVIENSEDIINTNKVDHSLVDDIVDSIITKSNTATRGI